MVTKRPERRVEPLPEGFNIHSPMVQLLVSMLDRLKARHSYTVSGLHNIPQGPCLIVVNHSLATYDVMMFTGIQEAWAIPQRARGQAAVSGAGRCTVMTFLGGVMAFTGG